MLIVQEFPEMGQLLDMQDVSAMGLASESKLRMIRNY